MPCSQTPLEPTVSPLLGTLGAAFRSWDNVGLQDSNAYFVAQSHGLACRSAQLRAQVAPVVHVDFASGLPTGFSRVGFATVLTHWEKTMSFIPP